MIENLLLDPKAIWTLLAPYRERTKLSSETEIAAALQQIAEELRDDEVRLRVNAELGGRFIRVAVNEEGQAAHAIDSAKDYLEQWLTRIGGEEGIRKTVQVASATVADLIAKEAWLQRFRGKEIITKFYERFGQTAGLNYRAFLYELAKAARSEKQLATLIQKPVLQLQRFVPGTIAELATSSLGLDPETVAQALKAREALGSTGMGAGAAIPHAHLSGVGKPLAVFARLRRSIAFDAIDARPVDLVCLVLLPKRAEGGEPLSALACIARRLRHPDTLNRLREAKSADAIYGVLTRAGDSPNEQCR